MFSTTISKLVLKCYKLLRCGWVYVQLSTVTFFSFLPQFSTLLPCLFGTDSPIFVAATAPRSSACCQGREHRAAPKQRNQEGSSRAEAFPFIHAAIASWKCWSLEIPLWDQQSWKSYCRIHIFMDPSSLRTQIGKDFMLKPLVGVLTHNPPDPTSLWFSPISRCCGIILLLSCGTVSGPQRVFLIQALKGYTRSKKRPILCLSKLKIQYLS